MSKENKHRNADPSNVKLLERALSLRERLFSLIAVRRGLKRLWKWIKILLIAAPIAVILWYAVNYALEMAYGLSIDHISYKSQRGIINKEQALKILGVSGSVNMATLSTDAFKRTLEAQPAVRSATIRAELPDTLYIEVEERIPIVYVEMESGTGTGDQTRLFMDPEGVLFPAQPEYHRLFTGVPIWYLKEDDVEQLREGVQLNPQRIRPITELIAASNNYDPEQIPPITEIFRPKDWEIRLVLESGTEVCMEVRHIREQMDRLALILDHARATGRAVRSANVIPSLNPVATFIDPPADSQAQPDKPQPTKPRESAPPRRSRR